MPRTSEVENPVQLEDLRKSRSRIKGHLTRISKEWKEVLEKNKPSYPPLHVCETRLEEVEKNRKKYDKVQDDIEEMVDDTTAETKEVEDYMDSYNTIKDEIRGWIRADDKYAKTKSDEEFRKSMKEQYDLQMAEQLKVLAGNHPLCTQSMSLKLPPLEIPTFNGNYLEWPHFYDLFKSAIHDTQLPPAQKLNMLRSKLTGDAALFIKGLTTTATNYDAVFSTLEKHYQNSRALRSAHLDQLLSITKVQQKNSHDLQVFADTAQQCYVQLENLTLTVDDVVLHMVAKRIDPETREAWELSIANKNQPAFSEFIEFVHARARALSMTNPPAQTSTKNTKVSKPTVNSNYPKPTMNSNNNAKPKNVNFAASYKCVICTTESHPIYQCTKFHSLSVKDRRNAISTNKLCYNCFRSDHMASKCTSSRKCRTCNGPHHTLLHQENPSKSSSGPDGPSNSQTQIHHQEGQPPTAPTVPTETKNIHHNTSVNSKTQTLLATAMVLVKDYNNRFVPCRALVDMGAQANFITEACAAKLGLKRKKSSLNFRGIGHGSTGNSQESLNLKIRSSYGPFTLDAEANILSRVTGDLPSYPCAPSNWSHLDGLKLADPSYNVPNTIDILLGAAVYSNVLRSGFKEGANGGPVAQNTAFGWILFGEVPHIHALVGTTMEEDRDEFLRKFWEIEECSHPMETTYKEHECEAHFQSTVSRQEDGRYMVRLPFKPDAPKLGESAARAVHRMKMMEARFKKNPDLHRQYSEFMEEYVSLGHMERIDTTKEDDTMESYYLPHHAVMKKDSATTKCRVVFDASAKTSNNVSLNDILMVGPTIQEDIFSLLVRFRIHIVAMSADIAKMYRQFLVHPDDRSYQRIVWRKNSQDPMDVYELKTVTYGTGSAPFAAVRCLNKLAEDEALRFPMASMVTLKDFYVDNLLTGCATEEEALRIQREIIQLMEAGQLELRQWASNSEAIIRSVNENQRDSSSEVEFHSDSSVLSVSTLGIKWKPNQDEFAYKFQPQEAATTKRMVLSSIARIFDPLGWVSPSVVLAKMFMKTLWNLKLDWDDPIPTEALKLWKNFESELPSLREIKIPRCLIHPNPNAMELHGFGDASKSAYGAVVYLKSVYGNKVLVRMVCSKTRISPVKEQTIPRLELCASVLLSQLMHSVKLSLGIQFTSITAWSDSSVTLCWIKDRPSRWKPFVANRVKKIQELLPDATWKHVPGKENPADLASRGVSPKKLLTATLWWDGPAWLSEPNSQDFPMDPYDEEEVLCELKAQKPAHVNVATVQESELLSRFSSYDKLIRVTAWMLRWRSNVKKEEKVLLPNLTTEELNIAEITLVKLTQSTAFKEELKLLKKSAPVHKTSKLRSLTPFLDAMGILRVGGRLRNAAIEEEQKNPMVLPPVSKFTKLLIQHHHSRLLHGGTSLILNSLHRRYWILTGRNVVRLVLSKCAICFRQKSRIATQLMGDLPRSRVTPSPPFLRTGVDYAGPIELADRKGRGAKVIKGYVVLFICMVTKAIHLELATDLTTSKFMEAFNRFISVRGQPMEMSSDCGTNFQGAVNHMKEFFTFLRSSSTEIQRQLANQKIIWNFNPPAAPHFGGLWEAGVKSVKFHLKRVLGMSLLTYEEYLTVLKQVEGALNSRPLTSIPTEAGEPEALTPGHFLIGRPITALPYEDYGDVPMNRLQRWALQQKMFQSFWNRWTQEYLNRLQKRPKWWAPKTSVKVDDIVLLTDERFPPNQWSLGRIIKVHPGEDELVRAVTVKTSTGEYQRPIVKIAPLPFDKDENSTDSDR